jgi:hypothetical protein
MPTTTPLLRALVDDAAVFPPGNSPLAGAVTAHARHRAAPYAGAVGPLLVPAASADDLLRVLDEGRWARDEALAVAVVARPGVDVRILRGAVDRLVADPRVHVAGAELGWYPGWYDDLAGDLPLAVELPRGPGADHAFAQVRAAHREGRPVVLKFRTGPTPTWPWPDEDELASFLRRVAVEVPFKLTGGLHHAVRGSYPVAGVAQENHGVLNVLVATAAALDAGSPEEVRGLLAVRDGGALAELVGAWTPDTTARVRAAFTAYGCCTVTDPLGELAALGLPAQEH